MEPLTEKQKELQKTIESIRAKKQEIEHEISHLLYQFQLDTSVRISAVNISLDSFDIDNTGCNNFETKIKIVL